MSEPDSHHTLFALFHSGSFVCLTSHTQKPYHNNIIHTASPDSLTFFGLAICCTYSIAGLRICSFFDIRTFIGGKPVFCIFKPIESSSVKDFLCVRAGSLVSKWLRLGEHLEPSGKRKACTADVRTRASVPDAMRANRCCLSLFCLHSEWQVLHGDGWGTRTGTSDSELQF